MSSCFFLWVFAVQYSQVLRQFKKTTVQLYMESVQSQSEMDSESDFSKLSEVIQVFERFEEEEVVGNIDRTDIGSGDESHRDCKNG